MNAEELCYTPAVELAALIRARAVSPVEVVQTVLSRIEALEPRLNAIATLTPERALDAAHAAERAVMGGARLGPLHGVPVTIKDLVETADTAFVPLGPDIVRFFWGAHYVELEPLLERFEARMDPGLVACIRAGGRHSAAEYLSWRARKLDYVARIHAFFQHFDLLLTPSVSVAAFPADRLQPEHWPAHPWDWLVWAEFSYPFNMSMNPAVSVPAGFTADGLPVGLQIIGRRLDDHLVLRAAAAFEQACPWAHHRPPLHG